MTKEAMTLALERIAEGKDSIEVVRNIARDALAKQEQGEPVAWKKFHEWMMRNMPGGTIISDPSWWAHHIYIRFIRDTTPQPAQKPWVGLTDEEWTDAHKNSVSLAGFRKSIEALLKEKNT